MHLPHAEPPADPAAQRAADGRRFRRAAGLAVLAVLVLAVAYAVQPAFDVRLFAVSPGRVEGLVGLATAPLLHGSLEHIVANGVAVLMLGTLAGWVYPRAALRGLPLMWLGSGLGAWLLGEPGSWHLGASGVTHGLMFLVFALAVLRRDRAAIAATMIGFLFYGGMLLTVLPHEPGISWQSHLGGGLAGVLAGLLWWRADPLPPRQRYSWEDEEEEAMTLAARDAGELEPVAPREVPVLWQRPQPPSRGVVLRFTPRPRPGPPEE